MMCSIKWILGYEDAYYSWKGAFMFGSIVSCTDPIAVVALLKELGAPKTLNTLIEGESLLNDAVGMVLYQVGASLYKGGDASPPAVIGLFCSLTFGGVFLGLVLGVIAGYVIKKLYNDEILVVNITLMGGFIAFFIAETVLESMGYAISGIMSIISIGVFMAAIGRTKINPEVEHNVHAFWHFLVFAAETTIFILAGVIVGQKVLLDPAGYIRPVDYSRLIGMYIIMNVGRLISLGTFYPMLKTRGYGLNYKEFFVIVYGGLRGAVGIAFAMIASSDEELDPILRDIFLFDMSGCAVLTLIINASTCGSLINFFGILDEHRVKDQMFQHFLQAMQADTIK
jgi:NhaP-type Na+/H+ or K+/H+ antiporter